MSQGSSDANEPKDASDPYDVNEPGNRVSQCYRRAAECRERAERASSATLEAMFHKLEGQWLELARSCELDESAYRMGQAARRLLETRR